MTCDPRTSVPLPLVLDDEALWPEMIRQLRRIGTGRVMLYTSVQPVPRNSIRHYRDRLGAAADQDPGMMNLAPDLRFYDLWTALFAERRAQIQAAGIPEVGIWFAQTLGHGGGGVSGAISGVRPPFQAAMDVHGQATEGLNCPLCPELRRYLSDALGRLAAARPALVLFDDDLRIANHGSALRGCFCPLHQAEFRRLGLAGTSMEELARLVSTGEAGPGRAAFWQAQDASLVGLSAVLGGAVRAVSPQTRVGLCMSCHGELVDHLGMARALAGPTRPFLRSAGAPYGDRSPRLANNFESVRIQHARLRAELPAAEVVCEADTYPHISSRCTAAQIDAYLHMAYASGAGGALTYAFPYTSPPHFETAFADRLERSQPRYDAIQRLAPAACRDLGLSIPWRQQPIRRLHLEPGDFTDQPNDPHPLKLCPQLGIPAAHGEADGPVLLVGWQAMLASDAELAAWAARGLVVDAPAALELRRRGLDCGVDAAEPAHSPASEEFHRHPLNGRYAGGQVGTWSNVGGFYRRCTLRPDAEVLSSFRLANDRPWGPGIALWQDPAGRRFAILPWDMRSPLCQTENLLMVSHARRWQLQRLLGWVGRRPLPAVVDAANLQVLVRQLPDRSRTVVTLLNGSFDPVAPVLRLDPALGRPATVRFLGPDDDVERDIPAVWGADGDVATLALPCTLDALGFCAVSIAAP